MNLADVIIINDNVKMYLEYGENMREDFKEAFGIASEKGDLEMLRVLHSILMSYSEQVKIIGELHDYLVEESKRLSIL